MLTIANQQPAAFQSIRHVERFALLMLLVRRWGAFVLLF
jgi:hypothetical protein